MKNLTQHKILIIIGTVLLLALTYFRENFLLEINAVIAGENYNRAYSYWLSDFFRNKKIEDLNFWKWGVTIVFSIVMSFITIFFIFNYFKSKVVLLLMTRVYIVVFSFVIILAVFGVLFGVFDLVYIVLRKILGVVQTPLPFFVLFSLFYFLNTQKKY